MKQTLIDNFKNALKNKNFHSYLVQQYKSGELEKILPEFVQLLNTPELDDNGTKVSVGIRTLELLKKAGDADEKTKYALLLHDIGKIVTSKDLLPRHSLMHGEHAAPIIKKISKRLDMPEDYTDFAVLLACVHTKAYQFKDMDNADLFELNNMIPAQNFDELLHCCQICTGSLRYDEKNSSQIALGIGYNRFKTFHTRVNSGDMNIWRDILQKRKDGPDIVV